MSDNSEKASAFAIRAQVFLHGVYCAVLQKDGAIWRLGSTNPDWRDLLDNPAREETGVWLSGPGHGPERLAVMCCGLGSAWPGMGRELYENFPGARHAMEELAAIADWDVLGLLAEADFEKIGQTRWQIPYLFMLEYAQWSLFRSLGLAPALICGHSLGELVALCLAGVYDMRTAWYLLDTRAEHMAELEAKGGHRSGMLAVPAPWERIAPILEEWPDLRVANRNTSRQYILGGAMAHLREARKRLRHAHVPAILLNMDLAFHNPAMRILRDISLLRLNSLSMRGPRYPVLSCVDSRLYPREQRAICERIADLDENTVDWVASVEHMRSDYGITHFLELGPRETLCGLVGEISPGCLCLAADAKGHEARTMRQTLAALFAAGFLDFAAIAAQAEVPPQPPAVRFAPEAPAAVALDDVDGESCGIVMGLLAETCHMDIAAIRPDMELRRDLGLRSSTFPFLALEAEQRLGRPIALETLTPMLTVADAVRFLTGSRQDRRGDGERPRLDCGPGGRPPVLRYAPASGGLAPAPLDPALAACPDCGVILACAHSPCLLQGAAEAAAQVAIIAPRGCQPAMLREFEEKLGQAPAFDCMLLEMPAECAYERQLLAICRNFLAGRQRRLFLIKKVPDGEAAAWLEATAARLEGLAIPWRAIAWADSGSAAPQAVADLLALEILHGTGRKIVWQKRLDLSHSLYCRASSFFGLVYPAETAAAEDGAFEGCCQFSRFADADLAAHGANAHFSPLARDPGGCVFPDAPWLPLSSLLKAMALAAELAAGHNHLIGLTDLRLGCFPALAEGITRICRIEARSRNRVDLYKTRARLCHVIVQAEELTATGRFNGNWLPVATGACIAARTWPELERAWPASGRPDRKLEQTSLEQFYSILGFGPSWRFIRNFCHDNAAADAELALPEGMGWSWELMLEGAMQAAMLMNALGGGEAADMAGNLAAWRFAGIGLARFIRVDTPASLGLRVRLSWRDERLRRYEGQFVDPDHKLLLAFHNLEFDAAPAGK